MRSIPARLSAKGAKKGAAMVRHPMTTTIAPRARREHTSRIAFSRLALHWMNPIMTHEDNRLPFHVMYCVVKNSARRTHEGATDSLQQININSEHAVKGL